MNNHEHAKSSAGQDVIMKDIQNMIEGLLKDIVGNFQRKESVKLLGDESQTDTDTYKDPFHVVDQLDMAEIKKMLNNLQMFLDNVNSTIAQVESGAGEFHHGENKVLDSYLASADNILEMVAFSTKDNLTGLSNRHGFDNRLILEWKRAMREESSLCLLIFSVKGFKYNDSTYDKQQKNEAVKMIAKTLEESIKRSCDFIARWSDDEFAVLLPITNVDGAKIVAQRIKKEFEDMDIPCIGKVSVCIGLCVRTPVHGEQIGDFITKAQNAFNKVKEAGCNKIGLIH